MKKKRIWEKGSSPHKGDVVYLQLEGGNMAGIYGGYKVDKDAYVLHLIERVYPGGPYSKDRFVKVYQKSAYVQRKFIIKGHIFRMR